MPECRCGNIAVCGLLFDNETYYCCGCCPNIDCDDNDNWDLLEPPNEDIDWLTSQLKLLEEEKRR